MQHIIRQIGILLEEMGYEQLDFTRPLNKQIDSIDVTAFVMECERAFGITISDEEQYNCKTLNDYAVLIDRLVHLKRQAVIAEIETPLKPFSKPSIDEQIQYLERLRIRENEHVITAIQENLIAVKLWNEAHKRQENNGAHGYTEGSEL